MKKFWEQVFLGFHGKNHLFQRPCGYSDICLSILCLSDVTLSNGTMHLDEKVLGTSFSWISWKKSLVPTSVRLFRFCSSILCLSRDRRLMEPCMSMKKFWEQVFLGFHGKNHLFQRKSGYSDVCLSILCLSDVTLSNGTMHVDEKVLGTSFSWISWKKSLVPT
jgi:hypothetical protein